MPKIDIPLITITTTNNYNICYWRKNHEANSEVSISKFEVKKKKREREESHDNFTIPRNCFYKNQTTAVEMSEEWVNDLFKNKPLSRVKIRFEELRTVEGLRYSE
jgi:hypothetical protein